MTITTYINTSEVKRLNKEISKIADYTDCRAITPMDVVNPVIFINDENFNVQCNYIYIPETDRYYFCKVEFQSNSSIKLMCHCDVLMSYQEDIKKQKATFRRQQNTKNLYISDPKMPILEKARVQTKLLQGAKDTFELTGNSYVLSTVAG